MAYAVVSVADIERLSDGRVSLTDSLGCTETQVECFRPDGNESIAVSTEREGVCVPLEAAGRIVAARRVTRHGVVGSVESALVAVTELPDRSLWEPLHQDFVPQSSKYQNRII